MSRDLAPFLNDWPFDPTDICARKIRGRDGREKLQVRLDLGILQMEVQGRPDGARPHGHPSALDYYLDSLENHRANHGTDADFCLDADACGNWGRKACSFTTATSACCGWAISTA